MATNTPNMNLQEWDLSGDPFDHSQLAGNLVTIDGHDHTAGKGKQIPSGGIADGAVTTTKIADGSVTNTKIADGSITPAKLDSSARPWSVGDIRWVWFPLGASLTVSAEWHIADGTVLTAGNHNFPVAGSVTLPNLIDHFPYGITAVRMSETGGSNSINLAHSHTVTSHTHTVAGHTHTVSHGHNVNSHTHSISPDGDHSHLWWDGAAYQVMQQRGVVTATVAGLQAAYVPNKNAGLQAPVNIDMETTGAHTHGGATGAATATTDVQVPVTSSTALTSDPASPGTSSALGNTDTRPAYVGLIPLIRILT